MTRHTRTGPGDQGDLPAPGVRALGERLHDVLEAATAAGSWPGLEGEFTDLAQRGRSSDAEPISRAEFQQQRRRFLSVLRAAARPFQSTGCDLRSNGLAIHSSKGHWGHILFLASGWQRPLAIQIFAGNLSPFLLRVTNGRDPAKPPPLSFVAAHVAVLWQVEIGFQAHAIDNCHLSCAAHEATHARLEPSRCN